MSNQSRTIPAGALLGPALLVPTVLWLVWPDLKPYIVASVTILAVLAVAVGMVAGYLLSRRTAETSP